MTLTMNLTADDLRTLIDRAVDPATPMPAEVQQLRLDALTRGPIAHEQLTAGLGYLVSALAGALATCTGTDPADAATAALDHAQHGLPITVAAPTDTASDAGDATTGE